MRADVAQKANTMAEELMKSTSIGSSGDPFANTGDIVSILEPYLAASQEKMEKLEVALEWILLWFEVMEKKNDIDPCGEKGIAEWRKIASSALDESYDGRPSVHAIRFPLLWMAKQEPPVGTVYIELTGDRARAIRDLLMLNSGATITLVSVGNDQGGWRNVAMSLSIKKEDAE